MKMDKFYTKPFMVDLCIQRIRNHYTWDVWDYVIEPSAGSGTFLTKLPVSYKIGVDIEPDHPDIVKQDFLTYTPSHEYLRVLVIGNPPFGRVSSMAVKFFNHASHFASTIAFIVPRTFRRVSILNKLSLAFHLIDDMDIPITPCAFEPRMMAKCCFQIWERRVALRERITLQSTHRDWVFLPLGVSDDRGQPTPPTNADFTIRAYGGQCGEIRVDGLEELRPKSWHWIQVNRSYNDIETIITRFKSLNYSISCDTARQNSIGRSELVKLYSDKYD